MASADEDQVAPNRSEMRTSVNSMANVWKFARAPPPERFHRKMNLSRSTNRNPVQLALVYRRVVTTLSDDAKAALIAAAQKGCFLEQTLGQSNTIRHRLAVADGYREL